MSSFKKFYKENRKKAIQSQKNSLKLLQLLMILCSYNFIKFSMCSYNFNVAVRISINLRFSFIIAYGRCLFNYEQRSEEHTSELQSRFDLVCRLLLEKKKITANRNAPC